MPLIYHSHLITNEAYSTNIHLTVLIDPLNLRSYPAIMEFVKLIPIFMMP